jgi:hypothetical protein
MDMDMWLSTQDGSGQLTPDGYTNVDTFSTPDDLESGGWSPTDDPFMKYSEDPPALIACVVYVSDNVRPRLTFGVAC